MITTCSFHSIAIIGGTGKEGQGLAYRFAKAGFHVIIGSRFPEKAKDSASRVANLLGGKIVLDGSDNIEAARMADIVVLTVPYTAHVDTLNAIKNVIIGKILIDATVPLVPPNVTKVLMPAAGSAAQEAWNILHGATEVTTAFQNISADGLMDDSVPSCDVLVTGSSKNARTCTLQLIRAAGFTGWDAGPLENSVVVEGMTSILLGINKQHMVCILLEYE